MAARIAIVAPEFVSRLVLVTSGGTSPYLGGDADNAWMEASRIAYKSPGRFDSEDTFVEFNDGVLGPESILGAASALFEAVAVTISRRICLASLMELTAVVGW